MTISVPSFSDFLNRFMSTREKMTSLRIPISTYLAIWVSDEKLHISEFGGENVAYHANIARERSVRNMLMSWIEEKSVQEKIKIVAAEIVGERTLHPIISDLWLKEDIVPFFKEASTVSRESIQKEYVKDIVSRFKEDHIVHVPLTKQNEVQVAELVTLDDYRMSVPRHEYDLLISQASEFKGKKLVFYNATPQGGGVALMRHALIRLYKLLGVDAHWYVLYPMKEAFDITKSKFHNVLQAVADPSTVLTDEDKEIYNNWIKYNATHFKKTYADADVIVIDDPQPSGMVPYIRKINKRCKIIYRSHIQIESHLVDTPGTPQEKTWSFIWDNIKSCDLFVSHPIAKFVPKVVPKNINVTMPATTDELDGLNKRLKVRHKDYYLKIFDKMLLEAGQEAMDRRRPYIIQVARFDPSKGIPDVIESYHLLVQKLKKKNKTIPQLVIVGHGSVDDPDGTPLFNMTMELLRSERYSALAGDVKVMRVPSIDQVLNVLVRESTVALQLSHKEGFEVKVTEALMKGVPVIAYAAGGIPLQIKDGVSGYLVPVGDTKKVAERLFELFTDRDLYMKMKSGARENVNPETTTVANAIKWLYLANTLSNKKKIVGNGRGVRELIEKSS